MIQLHPYNLGSHSAMALKGWLTENGTRAIVSHRLASNRKRMIVGWGAKSFDFNPGTNIVINSPEVCKIISCKKRFFNALPPEVLGFAPAFTSDREVARGWNDVVVVRHTTTASGGDGIEIVEVGGEIPNAPLYTKYEKKTHEYRLHILGGEIKEIQRKVFVKTEEKNAPDDWRIRNHSKGFIFQTEQDCPEKVKQAATGVYGAFAGCSFVALDVCYHKPSERAFVLEGNTAPGLEGPRVALYGNYLKKLYSEVM